MPDLFGILWCELPHNKEWMKLKQEHYEQCQHAYNIQFDNEYIIYIYYMYI